MGDGGGGMSNLTFSTTDSLKFCGIGKGEQDYYQEVGAARGH